MTLPASASPPRRPATSTSAAPARRCSTGSTPGTPAAPSCSASRTPTGSAAPTRTPRSSSTGSSWLGITWDEGPFFQGEYGARHRADAERLLAEGKAYRCFCTREELDAQRSSAEAAGGAFRYDRRCCRLSAEEIERAGWRRASRSSSASAAGRGDRLGRRGARPDQLPGPRPRRLRDPAERRDARSTTSPWCPTTSPCGSPT